MKLISFAVLSFLAITVSAYPRLSTGVQRGQQSQSAASQDLEESQSTIDHSEQEDPRESLQAILGELFDDYKKRQAAVGQLQNIIDEMEEERSDARVELNDPDRPDKAAAAQELFTVHRYLTIIRASKKALENEMDEIKTSKPPRTKQLYRNRYWLTPQIRPKTVKQRHSFALMETLRTCGDSASLQKYVTRQLLDTSGFFKDPSFDQSRAHGTRYLMLARMDALWTARKGIQIGILVDTHPFSVDHCILCDQQLLSTSIAHLVVECEQVVGHRIQSGLLPAIQKSRLRLLGRALDPGVENVYTWHCGGVINGEADLDQRWLDGTVEHESMGTRHDNRALAARVS
ncbi:hypothetical protein BASA62_008597 [Batrachochytrium salamandrivorans]|nr:hypothetical protein BASA62_008597 [Batrachochytrium salamandrivorans]